MNTKEFEITLRQGALDAERLARDYRIVFDYDPNVIPFAVRLTAPLNRSQQKVCRTLGAEIDEQGVLFQPRVHIQEHRRPIWCVVFLDYLISIIGEAEMVYLFTGRALVQQGSGMISEKGEI